MKPSQPASTYSARQLGHPLRGRRPRGALVRPRRRPARPGGRRRSGGSPRPSARRSRNSAAMVRSSSGWSATGRHTPVSAARRIVAREMPAIQTSGLPGRTAPARPALRPLGLDLGRASARTPSVRHAPTRRAARRGSKSAPSSANSPSIQPAATAVTMRPPERRSSSREPLQNDEQVPQGTTSAETPSWSRSVRPARKPARRAPRRSSRRSARARAARRRGRSASRSRTRPALPQPPSWQVPLCVESLAVVREDQAECGRATLQR